MLEFLQNYLDNIAETPKQYYDNLHQATINSRWEDTTQLYLVKEQMFNFANKVCYLL